MTLMDDIQRRSVVLCPEHGRNGYKVRVVGAYDDYPHFVSYRAWPTLEEALKDIREELGEDLVEVELLDVDEVKEV